MYVCDDGGSTDIQFKQLAKQQLDASERLPLLSDHSDSHEPHMQYRHYRYQQC